MSGDTAQAVPEQSVASSGERPSERIRIGTQRTEGAVADAPVADLRPKPVTPVTEGEAQPKQSGKHYPPPNVRTAPTPEEEAEMASLMAGATIDDVLGSATLEELGANVGMPQAVVDDLVSDFCHSIGW